MPKRGRRRLAGKQKTMWVRHESWQLPQLQRLGKLDPERLETVLNTLWRQYPDLFAELAIAAVDQEELSVIECCDRLHLSPEQVEERLIAYRRAVVPIDSAVVHDDTKKHVARLAKGQAAVWEVVREYRKLGSVERLRESFPGVTEGELAAALRYAQENREEVEALIEEYESVLAQRRAVYPYAG